MQTNESAINNAPVDPLEPQEGRSPFTCPHCSAGAQQLWAVRLSGRDGNGAHVFEIPDTRVGQCQICLRPTIWKHGKGSEAGKWTMIYPSRVLGNKAADGMPERVKSLYDEARSISGLSPRAACALLRVALDHLTLELNAQGENLDKRIGDLVSRGVPKNIQKAFDATRVCGNEAVHPEQLVMADKEEQARLLFWCVNHLTEVLVTGHAELEKLYSALPKVKLDGIAKRDTRTP